ncbi:MAG: CapA family protein [Oscillospiraceae bacterium]|nr:CapA family protein [Oscillospiraceae bacterium]
MKKSNSIVLIAVLAVTLVVLVAVAIFAVGRGNPNPTPTEPQITQPTTEPTPAPTEPPTEPPITKVSTATISSVGDMLMHMPVINTGYDEATRTYDLRSIFDYISDYTTSADLMVGNLETTLAGLDNGYKYSGYPQFNCPDSVVDAMKNAGFDVVLTANNHSYDTRNVGLKRTLEVIKDRQLQYLGTKLDAEEKDYIIADCNGIRIGLLCYTYDTGTEDPETVALNGITLTKEDSKLVNAFDYNELDKFYTDVEENLAQMAEDGAEATMLYIHWGEEYQLQANSSQKTIAQKLCDLGIDVIVGGHPHVVQPVELLTSTTDETQKTVCLYSMGNAVSNQRLGNLSSVKTAHTEDGAMLQITFAEYSDGTVIIEYADVLPFWVWMHSDEDWNKLYQLMPLDDQIEDWQTQFGVDDDVLKKLKDSYDRTMDLVGEGIEQAQQYYTANQQAVEKALGVK